MSARRNFEWPELLTADGRGIAFGGDYNPDQWSEDIWDDDIRLMKQAGVNTVALAIFSWDRIQPTEDRWDFGWLDRIIDKLGNAGIVVDLASATATAPLWLYESHPEVLPRDKYGHPVNAGSRQSWSPTSPVFKEYALTLCRKLAERYGTNPYVTAWHMGNEYGWNNREDYSDNALEAFRAWCRRKYGTIDALNQAWGTTFWGQEMNGFDEVLIPRFMGADSMVNPGQKLDFERFGNDMLLDFYKAERDAIAEICPDKPFTTNFMVSTDQCCMDYAAWAKEVNFVSNDHYFHEGESHLDELACSDALMDSLALGKPWYVMEHSTSAVQWKPLNTRKRKGETVRDSLAHVAMGADAINFFQWRASAFGAEAFHSAMVPHAGEDTKLFRQVCELGASLHTLADAGVQGTELAHSDTAILFSAESEWATRSQTLPSMKLNHWHDVRDWYRAFLDAGSRADIVPLAYDWSSYKTVVLPTVRRRHAAVGGLRGRRRPRGGRLRDRTDRRAFPHLARRIPGRGRWPVALDAGRPRRGIQHPRRRSRRRAGRDPTVVRRRFGRAGRHHDPPVAERRERDRRTRAGACHVRRRGIGRMGARRHGRGHP